MRRHHRCFLTLLAVVACRATPDSLHRAAAANTVQIDSVPFVDLVPTDSTGAVRFGNATDATRLSSGVLVIPDRTSESLRFISHDGRVLREVGRKGAGPGEFAMIDEIAQCGPDSIFVWDPRQQRASVFDSVGHFVRQFALPSSPRLLVCNEAGELATIGSVQGGGMPSLAAPPRTGVVTTFTRDGTPRHAFERRVIAENRPLAATATIAIAGGKLYFGRGDSAVVTATTMDGVPVATRALGIAGRPVSPAQYAASIEHLLLALILPADREMPRTILMKIPAPTQLPAFRALLADPTGAVWAVTSSYGDGETVLHGVDSAGVPIGTLRIPRDVDVREIGRDYLLGIVEDAEGEQHLLVYRVRR
ncbi:MAG: 6-bladed beta-propeller [Gemmatimonadota bacterium]